MVQVGLSQVKSDCFSVSKFYEIKCKNAVSVRVFSKKIAELLFDYSPTFRTLPCEQFPKCNGFSCKYDEPFLYKYKKYPPCKIPEEIIINKNYAKSFLRAFVAGDGCCYVNEKHSIYNIEITCYHPFLRKQISGCLFTLGIPTRMNERSVFISGIKNFAYYLDSVGLVPK